MSDGQDPRQAIGYEAARQQFIDRHNLTHPEDPILPATAGGSAASDPIVVEANRATGVDDPVRPKHYQGDLVMRIIEHFGLSADFYLGNVIKYILRHKNKAGLEDLKKGAWYLQRAIEVLEGKHQDGVR